jgi:selenocysteine lyase/cysteine desulfurase
MSTIRILEEDFTASPSDLLVPASLPEGDNGSPTSSYKQAKRQFSHTYPVFAQTEPTTGKLLKKEFGLLLDSQRTYADYGGGGQPMASVLRDYYHYQRTHILGNPHSSNGSSSLSTTNERHAREAALRFLGADPENYQLIWTANASAALGLIRCHYFQGWQGKVTVVMTDDMHNSVNGIRTAGDERVRVVVVPVNVRTLRVDEDLFRVSVSVGTADTGADAFIDSKRPES